MRTILAIVAALAIPSACVAIAGDYGDPYACFGAGRYEAMAKGRECQTMVASFYGAESGNKTASGARFNPEGLTAAHRTLPFGTRLRVCYRGCVDVVVNDRGPAKWTKRDLDLSRGAAERIGMVARGVAPVSVERL